MLRTSRHILTLSLIVLTLLGLACQCVTLNAESVASLCGWSDDGTDLAVDDGSSSGLSEAEEKRGSDVEPEDSLELWGLLDSRPDSAKIASGDPVCRGVGRLLSPRAENRSAMFRPPRA